MDEESAHKNNNIAYTGCTQKNGAVSMVNKGTPHHSFVYTLYKGLQNCGVAFRFPAGERHFSLLRNIFTVPGTTWISTQWVSIVIRRCVKLATHLPSRAEVKN
jgi:hypothetical protein